MKKSENNIIRQIESYMARLQQGQYSTKAAWLLTCEMAALGVDKELYRPEFGSVNEFLAAAADAAGYKINTFRRLLRLERFMQAHPESFRGVEFSEDLSVSALEMSVRIFSISPEIGKEQFAKVANGTAKFVEVRDLYNRLKAENYSATRSPRASARGRAMNFSVTALDCIRTNLEKFYEPAEISLGIHITSRARFELARPDAVIALKDLKSPIWLEAFEFKVVGSDNARSTFLPLLEKATFLGKIFRRAWFVFPTSIMNTRSSSEVVYELSGGLDRLDIKNVGIILAPDENVSAPIEIFREAVPAPSERENRILIESVISRRDKLG